MSQLMVSGVGKRYGRTTILEHVDLAVARGDVVALTGENGAGKTTLMRICAGRAGPGRVAATGLRRARGVRLSAARTGGDP